MRNLIRKTEETDRVEEDLIVEFQEFRFLKMGNLELCQVLDKSLPAQVMRAITKKSTEEHERSPRKGTKFSLTLNPIQPDHRYSININKAIQVKCTRKQ